MCFYVRSLVVNFVDNFFFFYPTNKQMNKHGRTAVVSLVAVREIYGF